MNNKAKNGKKVHVVQKPFLCGSPTDEYLVKNCLLFFGSIILTSIFSFIVCSSVGFAGIAVRLPVNLLIIVVLLSIYFNNGTNQGADAVARGEILYQKQENGQSFSDQEQRICFHKAKGFLIGMIGTIPLLIPSVIFALNTSALLTDAGGLPSWMQLYTRRSDVGNALIRYLQPDGMSLVDYLRIIVRVCLMPYVNIIGYSNKEGMLILERLSPVLILLPAVSYGLGYMSGRSVRTRIHSAISDNERKRRKREKQQRNERKLKRTNREPEQLN